MKGSVKYQNNSFTNLSLLLFEYEVLVQPQKMPVTTFYEDIHLAAVTGNPRNALVCDTPYLQNEFGDPGFVLRF